MGSSDTQILRIQLDASDLPAELIRLEDARAAALRELAIAQERMQQTLGEDLAGILEAQAMLLADEAFAGRIRDCIESDSVNAEWAVETTMKALESEFQRIESAYLRERGEDLRHVSRYLLQGLHGDEHRDLSELGEDLIIVADELTPSDALRLARQRVLGFVLESGGVTSHTVIVARGLGLPAVVGVDGITAMVTDSDPVIVDGDSGHVLLHPTAETLQRHRAQRDVESAGNEIALARSRSVPAVTRDGVQIQLLANLELLEEMPDAQRFGATGVGLYRSEFFYLEKNPVLPTEDEHFELYSALARSLSPLPVTVRTLDLGGSALAGLVNPAHEENPVLGLRGIRLASSQPEILRTQLRALYRASVVGNLRVMVPLVSTLGEVEFFLTMCSEIREEMTAAGMEYGSLPLGAMIEVPAAALISRHLANALDFLSIGTNDLIQYTLAVDRDNEQVGHLYQPSHPAVLRLLKEICDGVRESTCELNICGEVAADPMMTPFLLAIGLRRFSMSPRSLPGLKARLAVLSTIESESVLDEILAISSASETSRFLQERFPDVVNL